MGGVKETQKGGMWHEMTADNTLLVEAADVEAIVKPSSAYYRQCQPS